MPEKDTSLRRWGGRLVLWVVLPYSALVAFYLVVFRLQVRRLNDAVCFLNKRVLNPMMMFLDRRHFYAAVLRHKGRRSSKEYSTPVTAEPTEDGYVIPLTYGEDVDWLKNIRVAGRCTIEARDGTYTVGEPEVIDRAAAFMSVSPRTRLMFRVFGINRFLKVRRFTEAPGEETGSEVTPWGIAAERWEELREFRAAHPLERATVNGVGWSYVASGAGEEALLLLAGGAMVGEAGFTRIPAFEDRYRVIAPDYPEVSTAAELLDGLAGVLDAEGVRAAHVLGPSYGGLVAQCFVRCHPERVRTLVLANTLVPPRSLLWLSKDFVALLPLVPVGLLRALRERTLARAFSGVPSVPQVDQVFWRDYQHGLVSRLSKAELLSMYRVGIDLIESFRFAPDDLASWPGRVLILESDEDILTPEQRAELRRCYPQAVAHTFRGAGHTPWMSHKKEYLSAINEFLDE
jgi:deazaflavin-dependent oxidoreductase (nitroreductase family)